MADVEDVQKSMILLQRDAMQRGLIELLTPYHRSILRLRVEIIKKQELK